MVFKKGSIPWNKEKHWSEEIKQKLSESHKGKGHSEEWRRKVSEALKGKSKSEEWKRKHSGKNHPMFGKHFSEESRKRMSEARKGEKHQNFGKHLSEETKKRISRSHIGKHHSEETRRKLSESHKGQIAWNKGKKGLQVAWNKGKIGIFSEDTLKKMSDAKKGRISPKRLTIEEMRKIAISRGGLCLSDTYVDGKTKLHWRCKEGHAWNATPNNTKRGKWCPRCAIIALANKRRLDIEDMREIAKSREGECLSETYTNAHTHLHWRCKYGHEWKATPNMVNNGHWCHFCGGNVRLTIEQMQKLAASKGGVCLSEKYVNSGTKLLWRCKNGHDWWAVPSSVKIGSWCPICSDKVTERICRGLFEYIFDAPFPSKRSSWLINDTGYKLELDGYCETLGIAFEHQGKQHYEEVLLFHQNRTLNQQMKTDVLKKELCNSHNVKLIVVPHSIKNENKFEYIISECKKQGIQLPNKEKIDYKLLDVYSPEHIEEMRTLAIRKGGVCLSEKYVDARTDLLWRCKNGHIWKAKPYNIKSGKWCSVCSNERNADKRRSTIDEMKELAKSHGGDCLSNVYKNCQVKLRWRCKEGHEWNAMPSSINLISTSL